MAGPFKSTEQDKKGKQKKEKQRAHAFFHNLLHKSPETQLGELE